MGQSGTAAHQDFAHPNHFARRPEISRATSSEIALPAIDRRRRLEDRASLARAITSEAGAPASSAAVGAVMLPRVLAAAMVSVAARVSAVGIRTAVEVDTAEAAESTTVDVVSCEGRSTSLPMLPRAAAFTSCNYCSLFSSSEPIWELQLS